MWSPYSSGTPPSSTASAVMGRPTSSRLTGIPRPAHGHARGGWPVKLNGRLVRGHRKPVITQPGVDEHVLEVGSNSRRTRTRQSIDVWNISSISRWTTSGAAAPEVVGAETTGCGRADRPHSSWSSMPASALVEGNISRR